MDTDNELMQQELPQEDQEQSTLELDLDSLAPSEPEQPKQPSFTFDQVQQLIRLAQQPQPAPTQAPVDALEAKKAYMNELYQKVQQGDNDAFLKFLQVQGEVATLQAERAAVQSARQQTASVQAMMNLNTVLSEMRAQEAAAPRGFSKLEKSWYQRMVAEVQNNPTLYANIESVRKAGNLLAGEMVWNAMSRPKAPVANPQRDVAGRFAAKDAPAPTKPDAKPLTPEVAAAGFTSMEEFERYAKVADEWIEV